jgi:hypothetical protein
MQIYLHLKNHSGNVYAMDMAALLRALFAYCHQKINDASEYPGTRLAAFLASLGTELIGTFITDIKAVLTNLQRT